MKKKLYSVLVVGLLMLLVACNGSVTDETEGSKVEEVTGETGQVEETLDVESNDETPVTLENAKDSTDNGTKVSEEDGMAEEVVEESDEDILDAALEPVVVDYAELGVNEVGHIMVVMYHGIKDNPPYHISKENFIKDLTYMYENNYRLVSMSDYLDQTIDIEAGMTPIVFTFDDGLPSTFSLTEVDGALQVNPDTAVGIIEAFAEEHPDFGTAASLYVHATSMNFRGDGTPEERIQWLVDHGYELGNHSASHEDFSKLDGESLQKVVGKVDAYLQSIGFDFEMRALTYPYGKRPESDLIHLLYDGSYDGIDLGYEIAFREGPSGILYPPNHVKFSPYNAPRVRGSSGEVQDMWWFLKNYDETNPGSKYISDGNPMTMVVPEGMADVIDVERFPDHQVITYVENESDE